MNIRLWTMVFVAMTGRGAMFGMEQELALHGDSITMLKPVILLMAHSHLAGTDEDIARKLGCTPPVMSELREILNLKDELDKPMNKNAHEEKSRLVNSYLENTAHEERAVVSELMKTVGIEERLVDQAQEFKIGDSWGANYTEEQLDRAGYLPGWSAPTIDPNVGVTIEVGPLCNIPDVRQYLAPVAQREKLLDKKKMEEAFDKQWEDALDRDFLAGQKKAEALQKNGKRK